MGLLSLLILSFLGLASAIQTLPPVRWPQAGYGGFSILQAPKVIYIDAEFAETRDSEGLTLIPPSSREFAETFRQDLEDLYHCKWSIRTTTKISKGTRGIVLGEFRGSANQVRYENGAPTKEGYELEVTDEMIYIGMIPNAL